MDSKALSVLISGPPQSNLNMRTPPSIRPAVKDSLLLLGRGKLLLCLQPWHLLVLEPGLLVLPGSFNESFPSHPTQMPFVATLTAPVIHSILLPSFTALTTLCHTLLIFLSIVCLPRIRNSPVLLTPVFSGPSKAPGYE